MARAEARLTPIELDVLGVGAWSPTTASWPAWKEALAGRVVAKVAENGGATRPLAAMLPPAERRRAPDGVRVALTVAQEAIEAARAVGNVDVASIASVFASAHGDLAIVDYLCTTLASDPSALSPTKFHLSVHNAAAGHWSIAAHDHAPSTSIAAGDESLASGLLEAATIAHAEQRAVLFVAFDTPATGLLAHAVENRALFACALVVAPARGATGALRIVVEPAASAAAIRSVPEPAGRAVSLLEALANGAPDGLSWPIGAETTLSIAVDGHGACGRGGPDPFE